MQESEKRRFKVLAEDVGAWGLNVFSSVLIVLVNKLLIGSTGYGFHFVVSLSGLHFLASAGAVQIMNNIGWVQNDKQVPLRELVLLVVCFCFAVVLMNLSLMVNTVGFYQMAKLLIIPFVCFLEYTWFSRVFPIAILLCIAVVVGGIGAVTVTDVSVNFPGFVVAMLSVVATGTQQTACSSIQKEHGISSSSLLLKAGLPVVGRDHTFVNELRDELTGKLTVFKSRYSTLVGWEWPSKMTGWLVLLLLLQGLTLILIGPYIDTMITGEWVGSYIFTTPAIGLILLSTSAAILVNLSAFICLGRFSAVSYQVMGHAKTILILTGGVVFFGEVISVKQAFGVFAAIGGIVAYGYISTRKSPAPEVTKDEEG